MPVQAVIFDRDGVLTHFAVAEAIAFFQPLLPLTLTEIASKWTQWGAKMKFPRSVSEEHLFFQGLWNALSDEFQLSSHAHSQLLQFEYTKYLRSFADARPALLAVREQRLAVGVLSNFSLASLDHSLTAVNLADLVDAACAATVIGDAKPNVAAYQFASRALGMLPEECLFFDDEIECVMGGQAAGMHAYWVDRQRATHAVEENIVCDLTAIPQILAEFGKNSALGKK